jgi:hypothetical protein
MAFAVSTSRALVVAVASTVPSSAISRPSTKATVLPSWGDIGFADDRPRFGRRQEIHRHGDGRRVELSVRHGEHRRPHGVVEHRRENAALHETGRVAKIPFAVEPDPDPAILRPRVEKMPAEQS